MQSFGRGWNLAPTTANQPTFKVSSTFLKVVESKGKAFGRPAHRAKFFLCKKAQEGRQNSPADCFVVGNPRRGFPGACQRAVNSRRQCTQGESSFARYPLRCNCNHSGEGGTSPLQNVIRITQSVGTALAPVRQKIPRCKAKFLHLSTQKRPGLKPERFFLYCNS